MSKKLVIFLFLSGLPSGPLFALGAIYGTIDVDTRPLAADLFRAFRELEVTRAAEEARRRALSRAFADKARKKLKRYLVPNDRQDPDFVALQDRDPAGAQMRTMLGCDISFVVRVYHQLLQAEISGKPLCDLPVPGRYHKTRSWQAFRRNVLIPKARELGELRKSLAASGYSARKQAEAERAQAQRESRERSRRAALRQRAREFAPFSSRRDPTWDNC